VQEESGHVLRTLFGPRYTHVIHQHAAHVSYICNAGIWSAGHPKTLTPNPIDVMVEQYGQQ
jgi:hypothetical protein